MGIHTIGDLAARNPVDMEALFGKHGRDLVQRAQGIDDRGVETVREAKSVSHETTFARDIADGKLLRATLRSLAESVSRDLRRKRVTGTTVKLKLRWSDFETPTRQTTLARPTDTVDEIYGAVLGLFDRLWSPTRRPVRLLGVGVSGLGEQARQLALWDAPDERQEKLRSALEGLRARYGEQAVLRASDMAEPEDDL
jgi:DNA polymerase-4